MILGVVLTIIFAVVVLWNHRRFLKWRTLRRRPKVIYFECEPAPLGDVFCVEEDDPTTGYWVISWEDRMVGK